MKTVVNITSLSFSNQPDRRVWDAIEAVVGGDLIVLPETWAGPAAIDDFNSPRVKKLQELAKKHKCYIVSGMYRKTRQIKRINSAILIGRSGEIEGIYDKVYPFLEEFDLDPPVEIGKTPMVFDTDFGKLGIAICFDANIPDLWQEMAQSGAQIVCWPSAYSGGSSLQAHAINHHYYIVTATLQSDCTVFDITGREMLYNKATEYDDFLITSFQLNLNRGIFHRDFAGGLKALLAECSNEIVQETALPKEGWFVLKSLNDTVDVRKVAKQYGLQELNEYKLRCIQQIDCMRKGAKANV